MRRSLLLGLTALLLCLAVGALAWRAWVAPTALTVAVPGGAGSEDGRLLVAINQVLSRDRESVRLKVVSKADDAASAKSVDDGESDLAVVRSDAATPVHAQTVAILHRDAAFLLAPPGRAIASPSDLRGKRLGLVGRQPADGTLLATILSHDDVPAAEVTVTNLPDAAAAEPALRQDQVDAVLVVGPTTSRLVRDTVAAVARASDAAPPVFVEVADADAIAQGSGQYETIEILRGAFGGSPPRPADKVETLGVGYRLVASTKLDNATVSELTRLIFAVRPGLAASTPLASRIEAPDTAKGSAVPVHPGALAYYENEVETFFDRYDDWIYLSVMLLSILGSGFAGIVSTTAARRRARTLGLLDRLLSIVRLARVAESAAELDALEHETDEILAHALGNAGRGGLDEAGVSAFSLGLDQARFAIGDRRATLGKLPARPERPAPPSIAAAE